MSTVESGNTVLITEVDLIAQRSAERKLVTLVPGGAELILPVHAAVLQPEVGATPDLPPYGRLQAGRALSINRQVPMRLHALDEHQLYSLPTTARAAHADAPIFVRVSAEDDVAPRQFSRQRVSFEDV